MPGLELSLDGICFSQESKVCEPKGHSVSHPAPKGTGKLMQTSDADILPSPRVRAQRGVSLRKEKKKSLQTRKLSFFLAI